MRIGLRGQLFFGSLLFILAVVLVSGWYLEGRMRVWVEADIEQDLKQHAHSLQILVERQPDLSSISDLDRLADEMGEAISARVTLIHAEGTVLGDSDLSVDAVRTVENHAGRPEVERALKQGYGISRRYSDTISQELLYVAVPCMLKGEKGTIRVSMPLARVEDLVSDLRTILGVAAGIALLLALLVSWLLSSVVVRVFRKIVERSRNLAEDELEGPDDALQPDEIKYLSNSLSQMSAELDQTVSSLATERSRLKKMLSAMRAAVVVCDPQNVIKMANQATETIFNLASSPVGQKVTELVSYKALFSRNLVEFQIKEPQVKYLVVRRTSLTASGDFMLVIQDITEIKQLETIRQDFVANVSHELRTPVSVIRANTETLLDGALEDEEQSEIFMQAILRNAIRLGDLITDLLDLASIESGTYQPNIQPVSVHAAVLRTTEVIEEKARDKKISITVDMEEGVRVGADEQALDQILTNLIENAVKYTQEDGHINVRAIAGETTVRIEIMDDGPGVTEEHRNRIFERFYRVDPGRSRAMGGTGLGLAIVKHLTLVMDGGTGMDPRQPTGSVFWVELPRSDESS
tara:strand:+ start:483 stop:2219 length:1737 start_codon:yes stop_codon:yes gene_type:complete